MKSLKELGFRFPPPERKRLHDAPRAGALAPGACHVPRLFPKPSPGGRRRAILGAALLALGAAWLAPPAAAQTTAPRRTGVTFYDGRGLVIVLSFDRGLNVRRGSNPLKDVFRVDVGGDEVTIDEVTVGGKSVLVTLEEHTPQEEWVEVSYNDRSGDSSYSVLRDWANGAFVQGFSSRVRGGNRDLDWTPAPQGFKARGMDNLSLDAARGGSERLTGIKLDWGHGLKDGEVLNRYLLERSPNGTDNWEEVEKSGWNRNPYAFPNRTPSWSNFQERNAYEWHPRLLQSPDYGLWPNQYFDRHVCSGHRYWYRLSAYRYNKPQGRYIYSGYRNIRNVRAIGNNQARLVDECVPGSGGGGGGGVNAPPEPLTAALDGTAEPHDGENRFHVRIRFSEGLRNSYRQLDRGFEVTNGAVTGVKRVDGRDDLWRVTIEPAGNQDVTLTLPGGRACSVTGTPCTNDGRALSETLTVTVPGPEDEPLTAVFAYEPVNHEGEGRPFEVTVAFSEAIANSYRHVDDAATVTGGTATSAKRVDGRSDLWLIRVSPSGNGSVTVTIAGGGTCGPDSPAVLCTEDGRALSNTISTTVGWGISVADAEATEGTDANMSFRVTLDRTALQTITVDYATSDGTATAGADYTATSGTLTFALGQRSKTVRVPILDDGHDDDGETFTLVLSNPSGGRIAVATATGTIRNSDPLPRGLMARFGRATAEQVITHIEERMAAPRQRGFQARFAGRELLPGSERDFALGFLTQFAQPTGAGLAGAAPLGGAAMGGSQPMAMGPRAAGAGLGFPGAGMRGMSGAMGMTGMGTATGAMGMPGQHAPLGGTTTLNGYGPADGMHGGNLFSDSEFELNRESRGGILSLWSSSSRSYFSGIEDALSLDGDVRTTMVGADYSRGALTLGLSVGRTAGLGGYSGPGGGRMSTSMTGFYPWAGYQVNDRVSVWGVTGYGTGALSLTPDGASVLETGVSMAMSAVGTRGELVGSRATGGFALAFKADALWVGAASELLDGPTGRLNASEAGVTRVRTALEGSRGFTLGGGRLSLTPSVEVGLRRDGGDAETGAGMDVGGGLAFTDTVTGLSLDVRVRTLVVHQAEGFAERGMSLSLGWDPTPSSPLGLTARVAPSWGGEARGGAEALWSNQMAYGTGSHQMYGSGERVDAEVGYGLPVGARFVGTPRLGLTTSQYGRDYRVGYGLRVLEQGKVSFELGVDAQRRESPTAGGASNGLLGRASLGW